MKIARQSPFAADTVQERHENWILWRKAYQDGEEQTDGRSEMKRDAEFNAQKSLATVQIPLQRKQYQAVISRMNAARRQTGNFKEWTP